jgi:transcriptional regulator with GAF, ATPase, and Fis domain
VQCGAIPDTLLDSELFGREKGAFTGASERKRGRFERADGGTLFLDEIGDLSPEARVKLLRVLREKQLERVGGTRTIEVDVHVIAETHRDLDKMVREGKFREDLWYRLNVLPIRIPPLRLRRNDIPALVQYFFERKTEEMNLLAYSCKRRHFCPSCHQKRVVEFGQWLCSQVLKLVPHRTNL